MRRFTRFTEDPTIGTERAVWQANRGRELHVEVQPFYPEAVRTSAAGWIAFRVHEWAKAGGSDRLAQTTMGTLTPEEARSIGCALIAAAEELEAAIEQRRQRDAIEQLASDVEAEARSDA